MFRDVGLSGDAGAEVRRDGAGKGRLSARGGAGGRLDLCCEERVNAPSFAPEGL